MCKYFKHGNRCVPSCPVNIRRVGQECILNWVIFLEWTCNLLHIRGYESTDKGTGELVMLFDVLKHVLYLLIPISVSPFCVYSTSFYRRFLYACVPSFDFTDVVCTPVCLEGTNYTTILFLCFFVKCSCLLIWIPFRFLWISAFSFLSKET